MEASSLQSAHSVSAPLRATFLRPLWLQSDEGLVALTRRGNQAAFEHLVRRYRVRLLAFCRQMVRSEQDAEDLLQDTFTAAFGAINGDEREIRVRPWFYRIARNRCLNHLRNLTTAQAHGHNGLSLSEEDVLPADLAISVADRVARREQFQLMVQDIRRLPEKQRTALVLHELHGLPYSDVAGAMSTTVSAVKSLLVRARVSLVEAAEGRELSCDQVRVELAGGAAKTRSVSAAARSHVRHCDECKSFKLKLRSTNKALAALTPVWPLLTLKGLLIGKLSPSATAAAGTAVTGAGGSALGLSSGVGAMIAKTAVGLATVTALTTSMPDVARTGQERSARQAEVSMPAPATSSTPADAPLAPTHSPGQPAAGQDEESPVSSPLTAQPPPGRIVSSTPDLVPELEGVTRPLGSHLRTDQPQTQAAPGVDLRRTRPAPGAQDQSAEAAPVTSEPGAEQPPQAGFDNFFSGEGEPPAASEGSAGGADAEAAPQDETPSSD